MLSYRPNPATSKSYTMIFKNPRAWLRRRTVRCEVTVTVHTVEAAMHWQN